MDKIKLTVFFVKQSILWWNQHLFSVNLKIPKALGGLLFWEAWIPTPLT